MSSPPRPATTATNASGFLPPDIAPPSPAPSNASVPSNPLPKPRSTPLRAGSRAETALIQYLDAQLLDIARKHVHKYTPQGYSSVKPLAAELEKLVDVIWISQTPNLQIQYLLNVANSFNDYLASFEPELAPTFALLDKLDRCFYEFAIGGVGGWKMSMTEKVRLRGIVERTRLHVVELAGSTVEGMDDEQEDEYEIGWEVEVAKVYERTMQELGENLIESTKAGPRQLWDEEKNGIL